MDSQKRIINSDEKEPRSFLGRIYNKIIAFLMSLIYMSRVGQFFVQNDKSYENSYARQITQEKNLGRSSKVFTSINIFFSKSRVVSFFKKLTARMLATSLNVYGILFITYGVVAAFSKYAVVFKKGLIEIVIEVSIPAAIVLLSLPLLVSSKSVTEVVSESKILGRIARSFLMIPEESLGAKSSVGSLLTKAIVATIGGVCGGFVYWVPTLTLPIAFLALIIFLLIMSRPESGVMLIAVTVPFLQYMENLRFVLPVLIGVTCASYFFKSWSGKRVGVHSTEGILLGFFCVFLLLASCFSAGGWLTFFAGVYAVILVVGGFYITYNLMRNEKKLNTCLKAVMVSFIILVLMGAWDMIISGLEDTISHSWQGISSMVSEKIFYIADSASNFGIIACLICPILFCDACSKKSISRIALSSSCFAAAIAMSFIYGTFESLLAICVGLLIYFIFHSKKSFATFVIVLMIVGILISLALSFIPDRLIVKAVEAIEAFKPVNHPQAEIRDEVNINTWRMLLDGNLSGIGVGEHAFEIAFAPYMTQTTEGNSFAANLYTQIICWSGVGGLVAFCLFFAWVFKNAIGYAIVCTDKKIRRIIVALTCGLGASLMMGAVMSLWDDMRIFYLFWMMTALLCGYVRLGRVRDERKVIGWTSEPDRIDVNVKFH